MSQDAIKLCIIGDSGVGKTCISSRLVDGAFKPDEKSTIGASFVSTTIENTKIVIWDTAGQEKYRSMVGMYYRGASGAIIVYDITNKQSFVDVTTWHTDLMKTATDDIALCVVGNKSDLTDFRQVPTEEGQELAEKLGALFYEGSALNGQSRAPPALTRRRRDALLGGHEEDQNGRPRPRRPAAHHRPERHDR